MSGWASPGASPATPTPASPGPAGMSPGSPAAGWLPPAPPASPAIRWDTVTIYRPGIVPLRPLAAGEVLDGSFALLGENLAAVLALSLPMALVLRLVSVGSLYLLAGSATTSSASVLAGVLTAAAGAVLVLPLAGALAALTGDAALGRRLPTATALRRAVRPWAALLRLTLVGAGVLLAPVVLAVLFGATGIAGGGGLAATVTIVGVFLVPVFAIRFLALAPGAVALEGNGTRAGLRRAARLSKGSWWRVAGLVVLATATTLLLGLLIGLPFRLDGSTTSSQGGQVEVDGVALALATLGGLLADTLTRPILAGALAMTYLDQRMRREGLDLTLSRQVISPPAHLAEGHLAAGHAAGRPDVGGI